MTRSPHHRNGSWPALAVIRVAVLAHAAEPAWVEIPRKEWKGPLDAEVAGFNERVAVAVALPAKKARLLPVETAATQPAGLYEIRVSVRPSHVAGAKARPPVSTGLCAAGAG